jgi:hypothetical protein
MTKQDIHTLRTDRPIRYEVEQMELRTPGGRHKLLPGRAVWSIDPIELDTPEQARLLVGEHLVVDVEGDGLFHGIGAYAEGAELTVRITGPASEYPEASRS